MSEESQEQSNPKKQGLPFNCLSKSDVHPGPHQNAAQPQEEVLHCQSILYRLLQRNDSLCDNAHSIKCGHNVNVPDDERVSDGLGALHKGKRARKLTLSVSLYPSFSLAVNGQMRITCLGRRYNGLNPAHLWIRHGLVREHRILSRKKKETTKVTTKSQWNMIEVEVSGSGSSNRKRNVRLDYVGQERKEKGKKRPFLLSSNSGHFYDPIIPDESW